MRCILHAKRMGRTPKGWGAWVEATESFVIYHLTFIIWPFLPKENI